MFLKMHRSIIVTVGFIAQLFAGNSFSSMVDSAQPMKQLTGSDRFGDDFPDDEGDSAGASSFCCG